MPPRSPPAAANNTQVTVQTYPFQVGASNVNPSPANRTRRYLLIQNKSINDLNVQFGRPAGGANGDDYLVPGLSEKEWTIVVPIDSLNLSCPSGEATGMVIEGVLFEER